MHDLLKMRNGLYQTQVDIAQANALVEAERDKLSDGQLKDSIRLDETKLVSCLM